MAEVVAVENQILENINLASFYNEDECLYVLNGARNVYQSLKFREFLLAYPDDVDMQRSEFENADVKNKAQSIEIDTELMSASGDLRKRILREYGLTCGTGNVWIFKSPLISKEELKNVTKILSVPYEQARCFPDRICFGRSEPRHGYQALLEFDHLAEFAAELFEITGYGKVRRLLRSIVCFRNCKPHCTGNGKIGKLCTILLGVIALSAICGVVVAVRSKVAEVSHVIPIGFEKLHHLKEKQMKALRDIGEYIIGSHWNNTVDGCHVDECKRNGLCMCRGKCKNDDRCSLGCGGSEIGQCFMQTSAECEECIKEYDLCLCAKRETDCRYHPYFRWAYDQCYPAETIG